MTIFSGTCKDRIIYSIKPSVNTESIGPNVLYRYGRLSNSDGKIANPDGTCNSAPVNVQIADAIASNITTPTTCNPPAVISGANGFYSCVSDNQLSIALFSKLSNTKTYGINRTVNSGFFPTTATTTNDCIVPNLTSTSTNPTDANTAIGNATRIDTTIDNSAFANKYLLHNGINLESGGATVLSQNPLPGAQLPCGRGLVTYTY